MPRSVLAQEIKKRQPFTSPAEEALLNLMRTCSILAAPSEQLFKQHGISPPKYNILRIIRGAGKTGGKACKHGLPSLEIADQMLTRVPDITRLVDGLVEQGLVCRTRCTEDRRVVYVGITGKGLDLLDVLDKPINDLNRSLLSHLSGEEVSTLNKLLVKARKSEK